MLAIVSFLLTIFLAVIMFVGQIISFVFKLVPLAFFFDLIEKFLIGGRQIVTMILTAPWGLGYVFIGIVTLLVGYMILVGVIHVITNINIFSNFVKEAYKKSGDTSVGDVDKTDFSMNKEVLDSFRQHYLSFIKQLKNNGEGNPQGRLSDYSLLKQSIVLMTIFFQGGIIGWKEFFKELKNAFVGLKGILLIVVIALFSTYVITYKKTYTHPTTGEQIQVSNGYEFFKDSAMGQAGGSVIGGALSWISDLTDGALVYDDVRIKAISKMYYYGTLMNLFTDVKLVEQNNLIAEVDLGSSTVNVDDESEVSTTKKREKDKFSKIYASQGKNFNMSHQLPYRGIAFPDELQYVYGRSQAQSLGIFQNSISQCVTQLAGQKQLLTQNFIPQSAYNNRSFNMFAKGQQPEYTSLDMSDIQAKTANGITYLEPSTVSLLETKYNGVIPGTSQSNDSTKLGLFFIIGKRQGKYIINPSLFNSFKSVYQRTAINRGYQKYTSPHLLYYFNNNVTNFCHGYALYKAHEVNAYTVTIDKKNGTNFDKFASGMYSKHYNLLKNTTNPQNIAANVAFNSQYYLSDYHDDRSIQNGKGGKIFNRYFYMFGNRDNYGIMYLLMLTKGIDDGSVAGLIKVLDKHNTNAEIKDVTRDAAGLEKVSLIAGFQTSMKRFVTSLKTEVKKKTGQNLNATIMNNANQLTFRNNMLKGYKGETFNSTDQSSFMSHPGLREYYANLMIIDNNTNVSEINDSDISTVKKSTSVFFARQPDLSNVLVTEKNEFGLLNAGYKRVGVMMGIIPIIEMDAPYLNMILFVVYFVVLLMIIAAMIWFSGIGQYAYSYYKYKKGLSDEFGKHKHIELLIRLLCFYGWMKLYFIFTVL